MLPEGNDAGGFLLGEYLLLFCLLGEEYPFGGARFTVELLFLEFKDLFEVDVLGAS